MGYGVEAVHTPPGAVPPAAEGRPTKEAVRLRRDRWGAIQQTLRVAVRRRSDPLRIYGTAAARPPKKRIERALSLLIFDPALALHCVNRGAMSMSLCIRADVLNMPFIHAQAICRTP